MTLTARETLYVQLLGVPRLELNGTALPLPTKRAWGIVAYLALEGATSRDTLAELLWDEVWFENPRRNLRQELYRLAKTPLAAFLELGETVSLRCDCDARITATQNLISGEFLHKFEVPQAPNFMRWTEMQREHFKTLRLNGLIARTQSLTGIPALETWLEVLGVDALHETALQAVLRLEATHIGHRAALERYKDFKALLKLEYGTEPRIETLALAQELNLEAREIVPATSDVRVQRMLEAASLITQPFETQMLLDVTGLIDFEVVDTLEAACKTGLLQQNETGYTLENPEVIARGIGNQQRKILERRIAKRLTILGAAPEVIAAHLARAEERQNAAQKYLEAAELSTRQHQIQNALEYYNKSLELGLPVQQKVNVLQARVTLCKRLDKRVWREAIRDLEREARNLTPEHRASADLQRALWHFTNAEYDQALEFVTPHLERSGKIGALAAYLQGTVLVRTGQLEGAETHLRRALENKNALEDQQTSEVHNVLCALAVQRGKLEFAKIHNQAALKGFARSGNQMGLARALSTAGVLEMLVNQYRPAERMFKKSLLEAKKIGDTTSQIATLLNLSKVNFETKRFAASQANLEQGLALLETQPNPDLQGKYLVNLAAIERIQLQLDKAWEHVLTALKEAQQQHAMPTVARRALLLADMATERRQYSQAKHYLELAEPHITPELQTTNVLYKASLAWQQHNPEQVLEILKNDGFNPEELEYRAALQAFAYLEIDYVEQALQVLPDQTSSVYAGLIQAARIQTHAKLNSLEAKDFLPAPNQGDAPFMRRTLLQAFSQHHPEPKRYARELQKLELEIMAGSD
jgi:DNA-binding SARP family transcriptional activator